MDGLLETRYHDDPFLSAGQWNILFNYIFTAGTWDGIWGIYPFVGMLLVVACTVL